MDTRPHVRQADRDLLEDNGLQHIEDQANDPVLHVTVIGPPLVDQAS